MLYTVIHKLYGVAIRIGRIQDETPLYARPGLGTHHFYEAPGDRRVEIVENTVG